MPGHDSCCAFGCTNRCSKPKCNARNMRYFIFSKADDTRHAWVQRIGRKNLKLEDVTKHTRLCSDQFSDGRLSQDQLYPCFSCHPTHPLQRKQPNQTQQPPRKHVCILPAATAVQEDVADNTDENPFEREVENVVDGPLQDKVALLEAELAKLKGQITDLEQQRLAMKNKFPFLQKNEAIKYSTHSPACQVSLPLRDCAVSLNLT